MLNEVNFFEVNTPTGNKIVELLSGDISQVDKKVDIVVASAFAGSYYPSHNSLLGALYNNLGFFVNEEAIDEHFDYRSRLGAC